MPKGYTQKDKLMLAFSHGKTRSTSKIYIYLANQLFVYKDVCCLTYCIYCSFFLVVSSAHNPSLASPQQFILHKKPLVAHELHRTWSLHDPLKMGSLPHFHGVMDPCLKGPGDSRTYIYIYIYIFHADRSHFFQPRFGSRFKFTHPKVGVLEPRVLTQIVNWFFR